MCRRARAQMRECSGIGRREGPVLAAERGISLTDLWQKRPTNADAGMACSVLARVLAEAHCIAYCGSIKYAYVTSSHGSALHCVLRPHHTHVTSSPGSIICICHIITWQRIASRISVLAFGKRMEKKGRGLETTGAQTKGDGRKGEGREVTGASARGCKRKGQEERREG